MKVHFKLHENIFYNAETCLVLSLSGDNTRITRMGEKKVPLKTPLPVKRARSLL